MSDSFVDTNILVYAHDRSNINKHSVAQVLLLELLDFRGGAISIQVLQEFYVTVTQKMTHPLTADRAADVIRKLQHWVTHQPQTSDILSAIHIQQSNKISFWDAMIINSAAVLGCVRIYSEDLNHGQVYEGVKVVNPFNSESG